MSKGKLLPLVRKAKERGVIFDVGHAGGHFDFGLVERAMGEGIIPDIISSDLHGRLSQPGFGVVGDLPTTLTKFLPLGLSFEKIIANCTVDAARAVGWQDRIGSLEVGREADIAVLQIVNEPIKLRDSVGGEKRTATHRREVDGACRRSVCRARIEIMFVQEERLIITKAVLGQGNLPIDRVEEENAKRDSIFIIDV